METYVWFYDHVCRELLEETGVEASTVADAKIVWIQRMQNGWIAFIYYLALTLTEEEIAAAFAQRSDDEITDLVYIDRVQVRDYLYDACYEDDDLKRTLWLCCEYVDEILKNTEVMN